jgi:DNA-directed RNA polymerase specialized sigma24 family protein
VGRTLLILAAVAAGYLVVYLVLKKKIARTMSAATVLREVREEVNRILVELNQTTHRNVTLIEDRIASLSEMLARADKKIALARREAEKQELADKLYTELADRRREGSGPAPQENLEAPDKQAEAVRLAQAGLSPSLIARRLGLTLGEVELILSLAQRRR